MDTRNRWALGALGMALALGAAMGCDSDDATPADGGTQDVAAGGDAADGAGGGDAGGADATSDAGDGPDGEVCGPPDGVRPPRRSEHAGVYDPIGEQVVVFGGSFGIPIQCGFPTPTFESDTWFFDPECALWRQHTGSSPPGRARHAATYDAVGHRMIIFGGRFRATDSGDYTLYNDTWALDLATETWSKVHDGGPTAPPGRVNHTIVHNPDRNELILFGGNASPNGLQVTVLGDVWTLDLATPGAQWVPHNVAGGPGGRIYPVAFYDTLRKRTIVMGGADAGLFAQTADYFADVWILRFTNAGPSWQLLTADEQPGGPLGRFWGGFVHDVEGDRYIMFGGHDDGVLGNRNDQWEMDPETGAWTVHTEGDLYNKPANGFCDFPPDFTTFDPTVPERRNAMVMVSDERAIYMMGGKTDCGVVDDLVAYDYETGEWQELTFPTVGVTCLRGGGVNCNELCL